MAIDPELAQSLAALPSSGLDTGLDDMGLIHMMRDSLAIMKTLGTSLPTDERVEAENISIPGRAEGHELLMRIYRPRSQRGGGLLFLHGGAYVLGDVYVEEQRCLHLAAEAECLVASVGYALAPEEPFPAGLEDAYRALQWLTGEAPALGIDPARLAVGGSSAGAGLAAALTLLARHRKGPPISWQLLVYPMLDDRLATPSMELSGTPLFTRQAAADAWAHYLGVRPADQFGAAGRATDLRGLPPAYVLVAEHDPLRDEGVDYARRLVEAGVSTELHLYPGTFHGFELVGARTAVGRRALDEQARAVREALDAKG